MRRLLPVKPKANNQIFRERQDLDSCPRQLHVDNIEEEVGKNGRYEIRNEMKCGGGFFGQQHQVGKREERIRKPCVFYPAQSASFLYWFLIKLQDRTMVVLFLFFNLRDRARGVR
ncbi:hypothetical protein VULLAG_LOCUS18851 [Vulpes lagopus]